MRRIARLIPLVIASTAAAQAATSNPEIYLMSLSIKGSAVTVGVPQNITMREGYDNQPMFSPDGKHIYFTSVRADSQADIYRYDIAGKTTTRVTTTAPESEYSATVMPDRKAVSVIRVEKDSAQRLWRVPIGAGDSRVIYRDIKPVGYHTWLDANHAALFVLGSPNALVLVSLSSRPGVDADRGAHDARRQAGIHHAARDGPTRHGLHRVDRRKRHRWDGIEAPEMDAGNDGVA